MNGTDELHPIEALALVALALLWAALTAARAVLVPLLALALTVGRWRPAAPLEAAPGGSILLARPPAPIQPAPRDGSDLGEGLHVGLARPPAPIQPAPAAPAEHPLAAIAAELERLPVARLRELAGLRSKRHRKAALVGRICACV